MSDEGEVNGPDTKERRASFTPEEIENIKAQILDSIYKDIGKNVVSKVLWLFGAICLATFAWLSAKGHIKIGID